MLLISQICLKIRKFGSRPRPIIYCDCSIQDGDLPLNKTNAVSYSTLGSTSSCCDMSCSHAIFFLYLFETNDIIDMLHCNTHAYGIILRFVGESSIRNIVKFILRSQNIIVTAFSYFFRCFISLVDIYDDLQMIWVFQINVSCPTEYFVDRHM